VVDTPDHAIGYAMHRNRSAVAVIFVYEDNGNVIETHEHPSDSNNSDRVRAAILRKQLRRIAAPFTYLRCCDLAVRFMFVKLLSYSRFVLVVEEVKS